MTYWQTSSHQVRQQTRGFSGFGLGVQDLEGDGSPALLVFGLPATIFDDASVASAIDAGQHLRQLGWDAAATVDRYDARLLLEEEVGRSLGRSASALDAGTATYSLVEDETEEALEEQRYVDLDQSREYELEHPLMAAPPVGVGALPVASPDDEDLAPLPPPPRQDLVVSSDGSQEGNESNSSSTSASGDSGGDDHPAGSEQTFALAAHGYDYGATMQPLMEVANVLASSSASPFAGPMEAPGAVTADSLAAPPAADSAGAGPASPSTAAPAAAAVAQPPEGGYVARFAVPPHLMGHVPATERSHKVGGVPWAELAINRRLVVDRGPKAQIVVQTARFVSSNGGQVEVLLRVRQAANPAFAFLLPTDRVFPYYRWIIETQPQVLSKDSAPAADASGSTQLSDELQLQHNVPVAGTTDTGMQAGLLPEGRPPQPCTAGSIGLLDLQRYASSSGRSDCASSSSSGSSSGGGGGSGSDGGRSILCAEDDVSTTLAAAPVLPALTDDASNNKGRGALARDVVAGPMHSADQHDAHGCSAPPQAEPLEAPTESPADMDTAYLPAKQSTPGLVRDAQTTLEAGNELAAGEVPAVATPAAGDAVAVAEVATMAGSSDGSGVSSSSHSDDALSGGSPEAAAQIEQAAGETGAGGVQVSHPADASEGVELRLGEAEDAEQGPSTSGAAGTWREWKLPQQRWAGIPHGRAAATTAAAGASQVPPPSLLAPPMYVPVQPPPWAGLRCAPMAFRLPPQGMRPPLAYTHTQPSGPAPTGSGEAAEREQSPEPCAPGLEDNGLDTLPCAADDGEHHDSAASSRPPAEVAAIIDKLVAFVKRNGAKFEATVRAREKGNSRFAFLLPWSPYHAYYRSGLVSALGATAVEKILGCNEAASPAVAVSEATALGGSAEGTESAGGAGVTAPQDAAPATLPPWQCHLRQTARGEADPSSPASGTNGARSATVGPHQRPLRLKANPRIILLKPTAPSSVVLAASPVPQGTPAAPLSAAAPGGSASNAADRSPVQEPPITESTGTDDGTTQTGKVEASASASALPAGEGGADSPRVVVEAEAAGEAKPASEVLPPPPIIDEAQRARERLERARTLLAQRAATAAAAKAAAVQAAQAQRHRAVLHHRHFFLRADEVENEVHHQQSSLDDLAALPPLPCVGSLHRRGGDSQVEASGTAEAIAAGTGSAASTSSAPATAAGNAANGMPDFPGSASPLPLLSDVVKQAGEAAAKHRAAFVAALRDPDQVLLHTAGMPLPELLGCGRLTSRQAPASQQQSRSPSIASSSSSSAEDTAARSVRRQSRSCSPATRRTPTHGTSSSKSEHDSHKQSHRKSARRRSQSYSSSEEQIKAKKKHKRHKHHHSSPQRKLHHKHTRRDSPQSPQQTAKRRRRASGKHGSSRSKSPQQQSRLPTVAAHHPTVALPMTPASAAASDDLRSRLRQLLGGLQ